MYYNGVNRRNDSVIYLGNEIFGSRFEQVFQFVSVDLDGAQFFPQQTFGVQFCSGDGVVSDFLNSINGRALYTRFMNIIFVFSHVLSKTVSRSFWSFSPRSAASAATWDKGAAEGGFLRAAKRTPARRSRRRSAGRRSPNRTAEAIDRTRSPTAPIVDRSRFFSTLCRWPNPRWDSSPLRF